MFSAWLTITLVLIFRITLLARFAFLFMSWLATMLMALCPPPPVWMRPAVFMEACYVFWPTSMPTRTAIVYVLITNPPNVLIFVPNIVLWYIDRCYHCHYWLGWWLSDVDHRRLRCWLWLNINHRSL